MINKNMESDNWGQLLSDFGIEDKAKAQENNIKPEEPQATEPKETIECSAGRSGVPSRPACSDSFGAGLIDSKSDTEESQKSKEKKSIFSRFAKIPFFGTPPEVSLDSVIEGTKSPSLGGKAFTDNKLEKMPLSQERTDRQKKNTAGDSDTWSAVASQIDVLASGGGETKRKPEERVSKRPISSMFDDPIPESDEIRALKDLMGDQPRREETRRDDFLTEESDSRKRGRGRRQSQPEEKEVRGRGSQYRPPVEVDDLPETDFEPIDEEIPNTRGRGQRGSRHITGSGRSGPRARGRIQDNMPQEEWSEVDAALQNAALQEDRNGPAQRGGRRQRQDKRRRPDWTDQSAIDREPSDEEDNSVVMIHRNIPSWDEATGDIVSGNIARHKGGHSSKGRR